MQRTLSGLGDGLRRMASRIAGWRETDEDRVLLVRWAFAHYLVREPDQEGTRIYVAALRDGLSPSGLAKALQDSDEARELRAHGETHAPNGPFSAAFRNTRAEIERLTDERHTAARSLQEFARFVAAPMPRSAAAVKVSVILPVWNRADTIGRAIDSVLAQDSVDFELIVIDDGSDDRTREILARYAGEACVRVISQNHSGASAARNAGLSAAGGEVIAYLDSDNTYFPGYLARLATAYAATDTHCGYAAMLWDDGEGARLRHDYFDWARLREGSVNLDMNCFSHRRALVTELGGFDESLKRHNDYDLVLRYTQIHRPQRFEFLSAHYDNRPRHNRISTSETSGPALADVRAKFRQPVDRPLRVLTIADSYPQLSESYIDSEVSWMAAHGVDMHVMSLREPGSMGRPAVPLHRGSAAKIIASLKPDIIHSHWLHTIDALAGAVADSGLPVTIRGHGFDFSEANWQAASRLPCVRAIYHFPHFVELLPKAMRAKAVPMAACFNSRRIRPGENKDRKLVLRAAASLDTKDLETFFEAKRQLPDHTFVLVLARIAQRPEAAEKFVALNRSLGNPVDLRFDVQYDEMAELYRRAGIYLHTFNPAYPFGMPVSILEAMASGCVVLMRDMPAARIYESPGVLTYRSADEAVRHILAAGAWSDATLRQRTSANIERAYADFADDAVLPRLLADWRTLSGVRAAAAAA